MRDVTIYLAGPVAWREEISELREQAPEWVRITSTWLDFPRRFREAATNPEVRREAAETCLRDIERSEVLIALVHPGNIGSGGVDWECGYATALNKPVVVVGELKNSFCYLAGVHRATSWQDALALLPRVLDRRAASEES